LRVKNRYEILNWDSEKFGYRIACVHAGALSQKELKLILDELKHENFKLVYLFANPDDEISNDSILGMSAALVDEKVTFGAELNLQDRFVHSSCIAPYKLNYTSERLKNLALQSGIYSRFKLDPYFVGNEYEILYNEWIDKSIKKLIADETLIYYKDEEEKGLITLKIKKSLGTIGLVAVDESERGNSVGRELMKAAFNWFYDHDISNVEVVTQKANRVACRFYESLGFTVRNIENVYHIWIK
jgi:dTDP-4-amino-4,6-dideoxy-D-galactose acyltransferase